MEQTISPDTLNFSQLVQMFIEEFGQSLWNSIKRIIENQSKTDYYNTLRSTYHEFCDNVLGLIKG